MRGLIGLVLVVALFVVGCPLPPATSGTGLMLNMQPSPPSFAGAYDFELLEAVRGKACADRAFAAASSYWVVGLAFKDLPGDPLTVQAIAGAAFNAVEKTPHADSLVITRIIAHANGGNVICAEVYGRAIRLTKAGAAADEEAAPAAKSAPQR